MTQSNCTDFPHTPAEVTNQWISSTIGGSSGNLATEFSLVKIGADQGASAEVYRAKITWRNEGDLPQSLVFKFASAQAGYREYAKTMGTYRKEVGFYQSFGVDDSLPIPRSYFAEIDEPSGHFLLVLEDLAEARMARWFADGVQDVELALTSLAGIHATYWNDETRLNFPWLGRTDDVAQCDQYRSLLEQLLPAAKAKFENLLSDYAWATLDSWLKNWEAVRLATSQGAKTLVHREADMRQMFFPTAKEARFILFDWQSPEIGWGAIDACRLIVTSLSLSQRREHENVLVNWYAKKLRERGINDLPDETLWYQIKLSLLMNVLAHMFTLLWVETEETQVWQREHLGILGATLEDWQLLAVIDHLDLA